MIKATLVLSVVVLKVRGVVNKLMPLCCRPTEIAAKLASQQLSFYCQACACAGFGFGSIHVISYA